MDRHAFAWRPIAQELREFPLADSAPLTAIGPSRHSNESSRPSEPEEERMSSEFVKAVLRCDLSAPAKNVARAMAWYANSKTGDMFPSIETLARDTGYSTRNIHAIIQKLVEKGILRRVRRKGTKHGYVSVYRLDLSSVPKLPERSVHSTSDFTSVSTHSGAGSSAHPSAEDQSEVCTPKRASVHPRAADQKEQQKKREQTPGGTSAPRVKSTETDSQRQSKDSDSEQVDYYATKLVDALGQPRSLQLLTAVGESIRAKAQAGRLTIEAASAQILECALIHQEYNKPEKWVYYFIDARYDQPY
jgi:hypothetical protein